VAAFLGAAHTRHTEQLIVDALRKAGQLAVSAVATQGMAVVGHIAASPIRINGEDSAWFGLGPVSVLPAHQRRGIGSALVMDALVTLARNGAGGCVVLGAPAFYERFGFKASAALFLPGVPAEHFMAVAFEEAMPSGVVSYSDAFSAQS
jgi:predicted N-acetyltransferase YhbS